MKKVAFTFLVVLYVFNTTLLGQNNNTFDLESLIATQKCNVAKLTGEIEINNTTKLKSRYTIEERHLTRVYLKTLISDLALEAKEHKYDTAARGTNIYTILPATQKSDDYIIVGAHYDSVFNCPGANDNASGTVLIYSVLQHLIPLKVRNKNVIIVFFDEEEKGLVGSRAFAKYIKAQNYNIHSVHTVDQMGWDKDNDNAIELELPTEYLENVYKSQAKNLSIPVHVTKVSSTDHTAFRELGYNAIGITEEYVNKDTTPHYHKSTDTYQTINFKYLASSTILVYNVIKELISNNN